VKILVAGGAGYIGSVCTEHLLDAGHEVVVLDSLAMGHRSAVDPRARFVEADLAERERVLEVLSGGRFDGILHFAAFALVAESMRDPGKYFRNNVACGLNLLDAAVETGVGTIVFSSTCAVYGKPDQVPITETAEPRPINPYGASKLSFERVLEWYSRIHALKCVALRYFNAAGASARFGEDHSPETHLIPIVLQAALGQRERVTICGDDYPTPDGTCIRDYIHVLDLARAHMLALDAPRSGAFNLGTGRGASVREVIETARRVTGRPIPAQVAARRPGDPPELVGCFDAARTELGWAPRHPDLEEMIASAWAWARDHPHGYGD